jgi:hypothetical protein
MKIHTAESINGLLRQRHVGDLYVPECNAGSAFAGCRRLDAWVLKTTWSPMTTIGYEVKVSRGDWMRDNKAHEYRDFCHQFFFVAPVGVILPQEVPEGCGLIVAGARLLTKVKAEYRPPDPEKLNRLLVYVLMSRTKMRSTGDLTLEAPLDYWRAWLKASHEAGDVGRSVSKALREESRAMKAAIRDAEEKNRNAERMYAEIRRFGIDPEHGHSEWSASREVQRAIVGDRDNRISAAVRTARHAATELEEIARGEE